MMKNRCNPLVLFTAVGALLLGAAGAQAQNHAQPPVINGGCISEVGGLNNPSCTANDVTLTSIVPGSLNSKFCSTDGTTPSNPATNCTTVGASCGAGGTCVNLNFCTSTGGTVTFSATGQFNTGSSQRYDVGLFIETDVDQLDSHGNYDGARTGVCDRWAFVNGTLASGLPNVDGDTCADVAKSSIIPVFFGPVTIPCTDNFTANPADPGHPIPGPDGLVDINHCETWGNGADEVPTQGSQCVDSTSVRAGTGSKCFCGLLSGACIAVPDANLCDTEVCQTTCKNAAGGGSDTPCTSNTDCTVAGETCQDTIHHVPNPPCNDNNACTSDTCNPATGCVFTPISCTDNNACTTDACDPATGCTHGLIPCNDNNACTTDTCNPGTGCVFTPNAPCNDNNACTTDTCNPATGCVFTPNAPCNDNNACTTDTCSPLTGCVFTPNAPCNDNNACTTDTCNPATGCVFTPNAPCNDNNACTTDTCNPATGCVFTPNAPCNDNNACTTDTCNPATGCVFTPNAPCNDNNACTTDTCDPATGCVFTPISCDDNNSCTTDACDPATGCTHTGTCNEFCTFTQGFYGSAASASGQFDFRSANEILCCLAGSGVTVGRPGHSLTITCGCIEKRLPASGPPAVLPAGDQFVTGTACTTTVSLNKQGRFNNTLLGQTITLTLNLGLDSSLASFILTPAITTVGALPGGDGVTGEPLNCVIGAGGTPNDDIPNDASTPPCTEVTRIVPACAVGLTVDQLLVIANRALAGETLSTFTTCSLSEINQAVSAINESFDQCRFIGTCPAAISGAALLQ